MAEDPDKPKDDETAPGGAPDAGGPKQDSAQRQDGSIDPSKLKEQIDGQKEQARDADRDLGKDVPGNAGEDEKSSEVKAEPDAPEPAKKAAPEAEPKPDDADEKPAETEAEPDEPQPAEEAEPKEKASPDGKPASEDEPKPDDADEKPAARAPSDEGAAETPDAANPAQADESLPEREAMEYDVVVVGGGPAGLATAIKLKQLDDAISVVVLEKGSEIGAHILSGAVIDTKGLDALLPDWRDDSDFAKSEVKEDVFLYLTEKGSFRLPNFGMPKIISNHGAYVVSLGDVARWLGAKAEALGVEIYPGFAANEILFGDNGEVTGVATGDMGVSRNGKPGPNFTRGMELKGKYTVFAEGARGQLSKQLISKYKLDEGREPQKYGIGLKELWQVAPEHHKPGRVQHSFGWPLDDKTGGGSFLYHFGDNLVAVGFVLHLNYENPYLSPFDEFQRFKTHPAIRDVFKGGKRLSYGARALTEGGFQSVPKLAFPGGALVGCAAGFINVPRIKGSHNAVLTGILAAEHIAAALKEGRIGDELTNYEAAWRDGPVGQDLKPVRNVKPLWTKYGTRLGVMMGGLAMWAEQFGIKLFGTMSHEKPDFKGTKSAKEFAKIAYPKPDGKLTFDKLSSVFLSNTNHEEHQPVHLVVKDMGLQKSSEHDVYAGLSARYCPAGVYEWLEDGGEPKYQINAQNCVHCKTCDIKDPNQNITWVAPEGGGGPNYSGM